MGHVEDNKALILQLLETINSNKKTSELLSKFSIDPNYIDHVLYFEALIPSFTILVDEIIAECSRICVKLRYRGLKKRKINGNKIVIKEIEIPFAIGFQVVKGMIVDHWIIGDQITLLKELNLV